MPKPVRALIAIITYNRPEGLKRLLQVLQEQQVNYDTYIEILIVDNDCTGKNSKVVAEILPIATMKLNLMEARTQGIVSARNKAVKYFLESNFEYLIFIDDDEWPCETSWLQTLLTTQRQTKADIVTSVVDVVVENPSLKWVEKVLCYGSHIKKETAPTKRFYTNNLLIKRQVLETIKPAFDLRFAFTGSSDLHFCIRCLQADFKAVFTPFAPVKEYYPESRSKLKWFFLRGYRTGEGATRATLYEGSNVGSYLNCLGMSAFRLTRGFFTTIFGLSTLNKALIARGFMQVGSGIGTLGGLFGISYKEYKTIHGS